MELSIFFNSKRLVTTEARAPPQARQMGALKVSISSPGFIYEPYAPRESIPFWRRWFTKSGWRRTKEDIILEMKSAYAISKLRKSGYSKHEFYKKAIDLYKETNTLLANGDKNSLRKIVTEKMYSELKNEIKHRESMWNKVYWEMIEPVVKIRTLRARLIGVDRKDLNKVFIQLTLELLTKQKFEAYDSKGITVAGDKTKELVHPSVLNPKTNALPFLRRQHHISPNCPSILSITTSSFTPKSRSLSSFADRPTAAYYDNLVNAAGDERDFNTLRYLLNKRVRDSCFNTTNTFRFITNTENSLSVLDDLTETLARLDSGVPRTSAYNALIARLCKLGRIKESLHIVDIMARGQYGLSACSFHPILRALTKKKKMEVAWKVIEKMRAVGVLPDLTAFNYLLTAYCYNGNSVPAIKVMKKIEEEGLGADARTYDALVLGACRAGKVEGALVLLRRMENDGLHILYSTYMHVINALLKLGYYEQAVKFVMIYGGRDAVLDTEIFGILASKLIKLERLEEATIVLEEMERRHLVMGDKLRDCYNLKVKNVKLC
ncbi:pentatricopeptide repeat-containing protein At3g56030, mitochondrial-like isoform X3 [Manihot esculenta]|nr:pentatricopeptide repeat-containing protein At3g56030, mitochondrial-like isoform X3 [Manihot esculenta]XP_043816027.1 pentatricopeptide repeat-containing protein At3g56030, mitochondrial-like isoform X3 [Manihot esculenta]